MALTPTQQASRLFKKSLGAGETLVSKEFFSEPKLGRDNILPTQIWAQADQITTTAPVLTDGQISGVTQYFVKLTLAVVPGSTNLAYYHSGLTDAIPFNYGDGSYNYALYKNDGTTQIPFGAPGGDWLIDTSAGLLTWYGSLPTGVSDVLPPKISFYKYVGTKGFTVTGSTAGEISLSTALSTEISDRTSADQSLSTAISGLTDSVVSSDQSLSTLISNEVSTRTSESITYLKLSGGTMTGSIDMGGNQVIVNVPPTSNYDLTNKEYVDAIAQGLAIHAPVHVVSNSPIALTGGTALIDGHLVVEGEFVLVNGQANAALNGIYVVHSASTWTRRTDADGQPTNEIELGDFTFVQSGVTYESTGWALGTTDATGVTITPDVDTQKWFLVSSPGTYTTDGEGLKLLGGTTFYLDLTTGGGLYKDAFGLRVSDSLSTVIDNNTSNISQISTSLSTEISDRTSADISLSTSIDSLSGSTSGLISTVSSLSTVVSSNSSLITVLSGVTTTLTSETASLSTVVLGIGSLSTALISGDQSLSNAISGLSTSVSTEISSLVSTDVVLSSIISSTVTGITSLSTVVLSLISSDSSLSIALSGTSSDVVSLSVAVSTLTSSDGSLSSAISGLTDSTLSLSTALSSEISTRGSETSSLSSSISGEISARESADVSLSFAIVNKSGVTSQTAGSGLTYDSGTTSLNVNVDNWTIKIVNDVLVGAQQWVQVSTTTNVTGTTSGYTGISLAYNPVTPVSAYVNGIEYLVNPGTSPATNRPFFYNAYPPSSGTQIWYDPTIAGFDLVSGIDVVTIKFFTVDNLV